MAFEYKCSANRVCSLGQKAALMQLCFLDHAVCAHWLSKLWSGCACLCKHHHLCLSPCPSFSPFLQLCFILYIARLRKFVCKLPLCFTARFVVLHAELRKHCSWHYSSGNNWQAHLKCWTCPNWNNLSWGGLQYVPASAGISWKGFWWDFSYFWCWD